MRAARVLVPLLLIFVLVWWPLLLGPLYRGSIVVLDIYSSALTGTNAAAAITPEPRVVEDQMDLAGERSRVTWWIPGRGDRHPAILLINGATPVGNDDAETRRLSESLARAGYLVMLPEYEWLKEARLDQSAPAHVDAAFGAMLRRGDVDPERVGAFGFSVGGGILFAAASHDGAALAKARYLGALGAYFDIRTYLASVVSGRQVHPDGTREAWTPDDEARLKLPIGAAYALSDPDDRGRVIAALRAWGGAVVGDPPSGVGDEARALWHALAATDYDEALARIDALPASLKATIASLSPVTRWDRLRVPMYWLHDDGDRFEPVAEAERAYAQPRTAPMRLQRTRLLSHAAAVGAEAREQGAGFWVAEIASLLGFATDVLRRAG